MRRGTRIILAWVSLFVVTHSAAEEYSPKVGRPHPDFTLPNIADRTPVSLSQYRGKKVLLLQFASW